MNTQSIFGIKYATVVSFGTAALHIALKALNTGKGGEVMIPAYARVPRPVAVVTCEANPL